MSESGLTFGKPATREKNFSVSLICFQDLLSSLSNASILILLLRKAIETVHVFPRGLPFTLKCVRDRRRGSHD